MVLQQRGGGVGEGVGGEEGHEGGDSKVKISDCDLWRAVIAGMKSDGKMVRGADYNSGIAMRCMINSSRVLKSVILVASSFLLAVAHGTGAAPNDTGPASRPGDADGPPEIQWKTQDRGKGYFYTVSLILENRHDFPLWFVLGSFANRELHRDGVYPLGNWDGNPLGANKYDEGHGRVVIVEYFGSPSLRLVRLPPHGRVVFDQYDVHANDPIRFYDVCEATSVMVNGTTPLETWLPYNAWCDTASVVAKTLFSGDQVVMDTELEHTHRTYPKEKVRELKVKPIASFRLWAPGQEGH